MRRLVYGAAARRDLGLIFRHNTEASGDRRVARGFVGRLRARCTLIATLPGRLGRSRPEIGADLRSVAERDYVILFRYAGGRLEVVNIVEGHRDLGALLGEDDAP